MTSDIMVGLLAMLVLVRAELTNTTLVRRAISIAALAVLAVLLGVIKLLSGHGGSCSRSRSSWRPSNS